jgi:hypothetical protein
VVSVPNDFLNRMDGAWPEHRHYSARQLGGMLVVARFRVERTHTSNLLPHLVALMLRVDRRRWLTGPVEDLSSLVNLGFGFTLAMLARRG